MNARWSNLALWLICGALASMVLVRFFTETVPVLPHALNVIDLPIVVALAFAAAIAPRSRLDLPLPGWPLVLGTAFLAAAAISVVANPARVEPGPALVFVYGILSPLLVYLAVYRLWPAGNSRVISWVIVTLGLAQLLSTAFFGLPKFLATDNPDYVSGTFGGNAYQMVFFLLVFIGLLIGFVACVRTGLLARLAPALLALSFLLIVLAQYRAALYTVAFSILVIGIILGRRHARGVLMATGALVLFVAAVGFGARYFPSLKITETFKLDQVEIVGHRADVFAQLGPLYDDEPKAMFVGTGPGTYSSRGWSTFAETGSGDNSTPVGGFALSLVGGRAYSTDVSERYLRQLRRSTEVVSGSYAVNSPHSSYVAVAAEIGVAGLVLLCAIYGTALIAGIRRAARLVRHAVPGDPLPAVCLASVAGLFTLVQLGLLHNWLEVTRVTFLGWALLAIAAKEADARDAGRHDASATTA